MRERLAARIEPNFPSEPIPNMENWKGMIDGEQPYCVGYKRLGPATSSAFLVTLRMAGCNPDQVKYAYEQLIKHLFSEQKHTCFIGVATSKNRLNNIPYHWSLKPITIPLQGANGFYFIGMVSTQY